MEQFEYSQDVSQGSISEAFDRLEASIRRLPLDRREELKNYMNEEAEMSEEKKLYTVEEFAKLVSLSPLTIRRAVKDGKVNCIRLGKGPKAPIRFNKDEVDRVVKEGFLPAKEDPV